MQVGGAGLAIIDKAEAGPQFGAEGLTIALQPGQERLGKSRLGSYYARRADGGRSLFAPGEEKRAQLTDLKASTPSLSVHPLAGCRSASLLHPLPIFGCWCAVHSLSNIVLFTACLHKYGKWRVMHFTCAKQQE